MDVLVFDCSDYKLSVSTANNDYAWDRFKRRLKDSALSYCDYMSSREGFLYLRDYKDHMRPLAEQNDGCSSRLEWPMLWPVLFETCEYQFAVEFKELFDTSEKCKPHVRHQLKTIGERFKFYPNGPHSGILVGSVDFLNSPGKFNFAFDYFDKDGVKHDDNFELYVASPKLDTKNDLNKILQLVNQEYENYVFDYLTLTFSSYSLQKTEKNNSIIWLSIFKGVADEYFRNVEFIMSRPNNKPVRRTYFERPERIIRWNQREEERYRNFGRDAEMQYFRNEKMESTINTRENRFVKYSLHVLGKRFRDVFGELSSIYSDMDLSEREAIQAYNYKFKRLESDRFFSKVGKFEGFRQESSVLQQRSGYSQIYKAWYMLKNSLDLIDGKTDIGMKKIWELYEIWCFLTLKRLIAKVLQLNLNEDQQHIRENKTQMINTIVKSGMTHVVEFDNLTNGDLITLEYQHTYNRYTAEFISTTTEQRPDIVITIRKPNGFVLTYLYDAKYRVQDDKNDCELDEGTDIDIADYPLPDAINQMHRYRDAIYYAMKEDDRPQGKEVIGGYILFPGRTEGSSIEQRYYFKSISKVNIGAFPLLPSKEESSNSLTQCNLLEKHLHKILLEDSPYEHIKHCIPQKGLLYHNHIRWKNEGVAMIMMENFNNKISYFIDGKIAIPIKITESGMSLMENYMKLSYILFHTRTKDKNKHLFAIKGQVRVMSKDELSKHDFYPIQTTTNRFICVVIDISNELDSKYLDPSQDNIPYESGTERYDCQFATITQLLIKNH